MSTPTSPLTAAGRESQASYLTRAAKSCDLLELSNQIVTCGVSVDLQDACGNTALHWVCRSATQPTRKVVAAVSLLLELGASRNIANNAGHTAIHIASRWMEGTAVMSVLQNANALTQARYEKIASNFTPIVDYFASLVQADRATLFLVDERRRRLFAEVAMSGTVDRKGKMRIDIPWDRGLVGSCFQTTGWRLDEDEMDEKPSTWVRVAGYPDKDTAEKPLRVQNIPDVRLAKNFYAGVDREFVYRTESVMCVPIYRMSNLVNKLPQSKQNELLSTEDFDSNSFAEELKDLLVGDGGQREHANSEVVGILQFLNKKSRRTETNSEGFNFAPFTEADCLTASVAVNAMPRDAPGAKEFNAIFGTGVVDGCSFGMAVELAVHRDVAWDVVMARLAPCFDMIRRGGKMSPRGGIQTLVCEPGYHYDATRVTQRLVETNVDIDTSSSDRLQKLAAKLNISRTAGINSQARDGGTPLMNAVICGRDDVVSTLLEHGASPYLSDNRGNTALHLAMKGEHYRVIPILILATCDPFAVNGRGQTPRDICDGEIIRTVMSDARNAREARALGRPAVVHDAALYYLTSAVGNDLALIVDRLQAYAQNDWLLLNMRNPGFDRLRHGLHKYAKTFRNMLKCRRRLLSAEAIWLRVLSRGHRNTWSSTVAGKIFEDDDANTGWFPHLVSRPQCPYTGQMRPEAFSYPLPALPIDVEQDSLFPTRSVEICTDATLAARRLRPEPLVKVVKKRKKKMKQQKEKTTRRKKHNMTKKNKDTASNITHQVSYGDTSETRCDSSARSDEGDVSHSDGDSDEAFVNTATANGDISDSGSHSIFIAWNVHATTVRMRQKNGMATFFLIEAAPPVDGRDIFGRISASSARNMASAFYASPSAGITDEDKSKRKTYGFQACGLHPGVKYQFRITSVNAAGQNLQPAWSEPIGVFGGKWSARVEDSFEEFLGGSEEHILRARYEYLECCIKYNDAVERANKTSVASLATARAHRNDPDMGMGALLHDTRPQYGEAIRHMKRIRKQATREARMRRGGQYFQFWANRDFVPLFGAEQTVARIPGAGYNKRKNGRKDAVTNFDGLPGLTFAIDIGLESARDDADSFRKSGKKGGNPRVLRVKTGQISRGAGCISFLFVDRHTGKRLRVRKTRALPNVKVHISAFCPPGGYHHTNPAFSKAWEKNSVSISIHSRAVVLTRGQDKAFGNTVVTIVCPKDAFRLSGVCYYVVVDRGAFEISNTLPSAPYFDSPRVQQSLLTDRSQALWNRFTTCPKSTRKKVLLELQMAYASAAPHAHNISLGGENKSVQRRSSMLNIKVVDPEVGVRGRPLIKSFTPPLLYAANGYGEDEEKDSSHDHAVHVHKEEYSICNICSDHVKINPTFKKYPDQNQNDTSYHPVGDALTATARERCEVCGHIWASPAQRQLLREKYKFASDHLSLRRPSNAAAHFYMSSDASMRAIRYLPYLGGGVSGFEPPRAEYLWHKVGDLTAADKSARRWVKPGPRNWANLPAFTEYFMAKCVAVYFGNYKGPYIEVSQSRTRLKYSSTFFGHASLDSSDMLGLGDRDEERTVKEIPAQNTTLAVAEDVTDLFDDKVDTALVFAAALDQTTRTEHSSDRNEIREDKPKNSHGTSEESGLFACLGFSVKTVDTHADLLVEDSLPKDTVAPRAPPFDILSARFRRSVHAGTALGMLGYGEAASTMHLPALTVAHYEEVPILLQPSFVIAELKDELLGIVEAKVDKDTKPPQQVKSSSVTEVCRGDV